MGVSGKWLTLITCEVFAIENRNFEIKCRT